MHIALHALAAEPSSNTPTWQLVALIVGFLAVLALAFWLVRRLGSDSTSIADKALDSGDATSASREAGGIWGRGGSGWG